MSKNEALKIVPDIEDYKKKTVLKKNKRLELAKEINKISKEAIEVKADDKQFKKTGKQLKEVLCQN